MAKETKPRTSDVTAEQLLEWLRAEAAEHVKVQSSGVSTLRHEDRLVVYHLMREYGAHAVPMHDLVAAVRRGYRTNTRRAKSWLRALVDDEGPLVWLKTGNGGRIKSRILPDGAAASARWAHVEFGEALARHLPGVDRRGNPLIAGGHPAAPYLDGWVVSRETLKGWMTERLELRRQADVQREQEMIVQRAAVRTRHGRALDVIEAFMAEGTADDEVHVHNFTLFKSGQFDMVNLTVTNGMITRLGELLERAGIQPTTGDGEEK